MVDMKKILLVGAFIGIFVFFKFCALLAQPNHLTFDNFTLEDGLSNNIIHCALQDSRGYMWFGTNHGVTRFDGYKFTSFRSSPTDTNSLSGLLVRVIYEDRAGNLWIGTESGGLNLFDREKERFIHVLADFSDSTIGSSVKTIAEDKSGVLWIGTNIGIKAFDPKKKIVKTYSTLYDNPDSPSDNYIRVLQFDNLGKLWVGTNKGLDIFDPQTGRFQKVYHAEPKLKDEIWEIYSDPQGNIWVGTYNNGLFVFEPGIYHGKQVILDKKNDRSNTVRSVICDKSGLYWIGSRGGLYSYNPKRNNAVLFENDESDSKSLVHNSILDIATDIKGDIWICTRGGISLMVPERQIFQHFKALPDNSNYLNNSEVYAIWTDSNTGNIWLGTDKGGVNILNRKNGKYSYLTRNSGNPNSISSNCIKAFMDDGEGNIWIGTFRGGINVYNLKSKRFSYYRNEPSNPNSLSHNVVWALYRDKKGNIWVGCETGLERFDPATKQFIHYRNIDQSQQVLWINEDASGDLWMGQGSRTTIFNPQTGATVSIAEQGRWFYQDTKGRYWIATLNNGLVLYDKIKGTKKYYDEKDGLPNNQVFHIIEDYNGYLWLSTANGLACFNPQNEEFINYDVKDGLQDNQFLYGAGHKTASGEIIFGGINGFNIFDPRQVIKNTYKPPIVITDFKIFNKSVGINDSHAVLSKSISVTDQISIPYKFNVVTFEFAALNYAKSERNRYKYKLDGFEKEWIESGFHRTATYTNLDPGEYTFRVLASNNDNVWNEEGISLRVNILPPYWKTWWFKTIILLIICGVIYLLIVFIVNREKLKHELVFERVRAKKLHEIEMMKLRFFTNISHEIRTPLTLIIGPLEKILQNNKLPDEIKGNLELMQKNAKQLHKLINQLLDYRKIEAGKLKLELSKGDIVGFVRELVNSFSDFAKDKGVKIKFNTVNNQLHVLFDADKMEKILNNLLSNALKFTDKGGSIIVNLALIFDNTDGAGNNREEEKYIEIVVKDTGIGIPEPSLEKIFTRFFQSPGNKEKTGTGIGLALTHELVKLHKGQIFVESKPGKGSKFTLRIPYKTELDKDLPVPEVSINEEKEGKHFPILETEQGEKEYTSERILLVVEDNKDVRLFIRSNFEPEYKVIEASDGKEGLSVAFKVIPDIIISDILMPVMDGFEFCKKLKKDEKTSHIPIIILTALTSKDHTLDGLQSGADDYITKPFDITILRTKVDNLLSLRQIMRDKYTSELVLQPTNISITSPDEKFLRRSIEIIEKYIDDPDLDIEKFSEELGVSRMQLYRKLAALTEMTVKEFIRNIRLKRAAQLLVQKKLTISEVAYSVGFRDLSHFRKCFREEFGMSATEYMERTSS
jgi:signal transduction histidine kinase/ligand-binding sensor domain-containing protein/DNA-binding response OmpR family regulator